MQSAYSSIESLPTDLLEEVMAWVADADLKRVATASRRMYKVTRREAAKIVIILELRRDNLAEQVKELRREDTQFALSHRAIELRSLICLPVDDEEDPDVSDAALEAIIDQLQLPPTIRLLSLHHHGNNNTSPIFTPLLANLSNQCPGLRQLQFRGETGDLGPDIDQHLGTLTHLRRLAISIRNARLSHVRFHLLPQSLAHLEVYRLRWLSLEGLAECVGRLSRLRSLTLTFMRPGGSAAVLKALASSSEGHLQALRLSDARRTNADDVEGIESSESLSYELSKALTALSARPIPLIRLQLDGIEGWDSSVHLALLSRAFSSSLRALTLSNMTDCRFPANTTWPALRTIEFSNVGVLGTVGDVTSPPIFPRVFRVSLSRISDYDGEGSLFLALQDLSLTSRVSLNVTRAIVRQPLSDLTCASLHAPNVGQHIETLQGIPIRRLLLRSTHRASLETNHLGQIFFPTHDAIDEIILEPWHSPIGQGLHTLPL